MTRSDLGKAWAERDSAHKFNVSMVDAEQPYVRVRVEGAATKSAMIQFLSAAATLAAKHNTRRYLFDLQDAEVATSPIDDYEIAYKELGNIGIRRESRMAVLVQSKSAEDMFFTIVALNAGYICETFFDDATAAQWLLS